MPLRSRTDNTIRPLHLLSAAVFSVAIAVQSTSPATAEEPALDLEEYYDCVERTSSDSIDQHGQYDVGLVLAACCIGAGGNPKESVPGDTSSTTDCSAPAPLSAPDTPQKPQAPGQVVQPDLAPAPTPMKPAAPGSVVPPPAVG
jgi:hypothetical protein